MFIIFVLFCDKCLISVFVFGIVSGFFWLMIGLVLFVWFKDEFLFWFVIGLFGVIFVVYLFNWLWVFFIDCIKLFFLG